MPVPRSERGDHGQDEREVARPLAVVAASHLVDAPHGLRIEPEPCVEREPAAVDAAERDPALPSLLDRLGQLHGRRDRLGREPERARQDARAAARKKADRHVALEPVQRLVEAAVSREHDQHLAARAAGIGDELRGVPRVLRLHDRELDDARELALDRGEPRVGDAGRERIDDEDCLHLHDHLALRALAQAQLE